MKKKLKKEIDAYLEKEIPLRVQTAYLECEMKRIKKEHKDWRLMSELNDLTNKIVYGSTKSKEKYNCARQNEDYGYNPLANCCQNSEEK